MARLSAGCFVLDPCNLDHEELSSLLNRIFKKGVTDIDVLARPGVIISRRKDGSLRQYAIPPGSLVIRSEVDDIARDFSRNIYLLARDAWLDTGVLNLSTFLQTLDSVFKAIHSQHSTTIDSGDLRFETHPTGNVSTGIVVIDSFKIPLYWLGDRSDPLHESYKELFKRSNDPNLHVMSYSRLTHSGFEPLTGFKHVGNKVVFVINSPQPSSHVLKYLSWFLIDILLDKP